MNFGWPQVIFICLFFGDIVLSFVKAGEQKGEYNPIATIIAVAVEVWILAAGGFFK